MPAKAGIHVGQTDTPVLDAVWIPARGRDDSRAVKVPRHALTSYGLYRA